MESDLLTLPAEVRVLIFKKLPQQDILELRLANKKIKKEIDEHVEFQICIDQAYRGFRKLTKFHVTVCRVASLTHHKLQKGSLFSYPSKLKKLALDGNISQNNLLKILSYCAEIQTLEFTHETLGIVNLLQGPRIEEQLRNNLNHVSNLTIQLLRYPLGDPFESETNMNILMSLSLPALKKFKLCYSLWGNYLNVFIFLQRHAHSLKEVELQLGDKGDVRNTRSFLNSNKVANANLRSVLDMEVLKSIRFTSFNFRDDVLNLNEMATQILFEILEKQNCLKVFQFHSPGDLTVLNLKTIVTNNESTIKEIVISNLKNLMFIRHLEEGRRGIPLNLSLFERCHNLRILALSCNSGLNDNGVEVMSIRLTRFYTIPSTVERLHLTGFDMNLQELVEFSRNPINLKELLIADAGVMQYSIVLSCFLRNCEHLEYFNVRPVITRASGDAGWYNEIEELTRLYDRFMRIPYDPFDDLEGFEAKITPSDRQWLVETAYPNII